MLLDLEKKIESYYFTDTSHMYKTIISSRYLIPVHNEFVEDIYHVDLYWRFI